MLSVHVERATGPDCRKAIGAFGVTFSDPSGTKAPVIRTGTQTLVSPGRKAARTRAYFYFWRFT